MKEKNNRYFVVIEQTNNIGGGVKTTIMNEEQLKKVSFGSFMIYELKNETLINLNEL